VLVILNSPWPHVGAEATDLLTMRQAMKVMRAMP
jgi:hypothetical protein